MDDLISRQAAIDALGDIHPLDYNAQAYKARLEKLPAAEPEIIRCKDCKHWQKSSINYNEYVCYWGGYVKQEDDFCSWAERKEE